MGRAAPQGEQRGESEGRNGRRRAGKVPGRSPGLGSRSRSLGCFLGTGGTAPGAVGSFSVPPWNPSASERWESFGKRVRCLAVLSSCYFDFLITLFAFVFVKEEPLPLGKERVGFPFRSEIWQLTRSRNVTTCSELWGFGIIAACMQSVFKISL